MAYKFCLLIFLLFTILNTGAAQIHDNKMEKLVEQLQTSIHNKSQELLYIQTSKGIYEILEDLWFKVYLLDSHTFTSSTLCQTLYLQMLSEIDKKIVWQEKYEVKNGNVEGHIYLKDLLSEGNYLLMACTSSSFLNDSSDMKAIKRVIIKKIVSDDRGIKKDPQNPLSRFKNDPIQFSIFPEGGNLVSGIEANIAFKAMNKDENPIDIQGVLIEDTVPVLNFKSTHAGMGNFNFTLIPGKKYHIKLYNTLSDTIFNLPEIQRIGITLKLLSRTDQYLEFLVSQSTSLTKKVIYLRGQERGNVYCIAKGILKNGLKIKIPLKEFPYQGIAEFTVFNDSLQPLAERLVYVNPLKHLNIEAKLDKENYQTREKATLKITVKDEFGNPSIANLGISVFDRLYNNKEEPDNILTHCFITSQIKGKIYDPAYYFDSNNKNRFQALDLLLITQGWRRYIWDEAIINGSNNKYNKVIYDWVEGEVHSTKSLNKSRNEHQFVMAFNPGKNNLKDIKLADSTGKFIITAENLKTWQGGYVYLKPLTIPEYKPIITIAEPFSIINSILKQKEFNYPVSGPIISENQESNDSYIDGHNIVKIDEITVKGYGNKVFRDKYIGYLDSIEKYKSCIDYVCTAGFLNCPVHLNDKTNTKPIDGKSYLHYRGFEWIEGTNRGYKIQGEYYEFYHLPKFTEEELLKMNNLYRVKAYYPNRQFYQTKYDINAWTDSIPDYRNTLLWAPSITTNERGEASVEFYCSDINTGFIGCIEGVNINGLLGRKSFEFHVIKKNKKNE